MNCVPIKASGPCYGCTKWQFLLHSVWDGANASYYCEACCVVCHPEAAEKMEPVVTIEGEQMNLLGDGTE
jgi:hypothetical protein